MGFRGFRSFSWLPGRLSCPPGPISGSAFLWWCFCRPRPPCMPKGARMQIVPQGIVYDRSGTDCAFDVRSNAVSCGAAAPQTPALSWGAPAPQTPRFMLGGSATPDPQSKIRRTSTIRNGCNPHRTHGMHRLASGVCGRGPQGPPLQVFEKQTACGFERGMSRLSLAHALHPPPTADTPRACCEHTGLADGFFPTLVDRQSPQLLCQWPRPYLGGPLAAILPFERFFSMGFSN